jgi:hypothetical protein
MELLAHLSETGREVILWSAGGADYAEARANDHGMSGFIARFEAKDARDGSGAYRIEALGRPLNEMVFVDDRPEDMPTGATVVAVSPYLSHHPHDRGLLPAIERARTESGG